MHVFQPLRRRLTELPRAHSLDQHSKSEAEPELIVDEEEGGEKDIESIVRGIAAAKEGKM